MDHFQIRPANEKDIPFIVEIIISAEKSGTNTLSYCTLFGLSEEQAKEYLAQMLAEEVDDCELSVSSYLIATLHNEPVAGVGAWIEGFNGLSSNLLKRNLLTYTVPKHCFEYAIKASAAVSDLYLPETNASIQIGMVYVKENFRGNGLAPQLIEAQIIKLSETNSHIETIEVQVFANNESAIHCYHKLGFVKSNESISNKSDAKHFFPDNRKILMSKHI